MNHLPDVFSLHRQGFVKDWKVVSHTIMDNIKNLNTAYGSTSQKPQLMYPTSVGVIHEESSKPNKNVEKEMTQKLQKSADEIMGETTDLNGEKIKIEYRQAQTWQMDIVEKFCEKTKEKTTEIIQSGISEDETAETKSIA